MAEPSERRTRRSQAGSLGGQARREQAASRITVLREPRRGRPQGYGPTCLTALSPPGVGRLAILNWPRGRADRYPGLTPNDQASNDSFAWMSLLTPCWRIEANVTGSKKEATGAEAGLSGDAQIRIALEPIRARGGAASIQEIYDAVEGNLNQRGFTLSQQGRDSLRFFVNRIAVKAGYIHPFDRADPRWRITPEGREYLDASPEENEVAVNVDTGAEEEVQSSSARGAAFEQWMLPLLRCWYPHYSWIHQGRFKKNERGLDFVASRIGDARGEAETIGVQVKFHGKDNAPTEVEWLKFLAGCFARRVHTAIFVTTGQLRSEQRREAQEAGVRIVEGRDELSRLARLHGIADFELFEDHSEATAE